MDDEDIKKEQQYLKKRLQLAAQENDLLRKENQSQRKELQSLKQTFTNIVTDKRVQTAGPNGKSTNTNQAERFQGEQALRQILEMQRQRIDQIELENEAIKGKYEKILFQSKQQEVSKVSYSQTLANQYATDSGELFEVKIRNKELEDRIKDMVTQHAKELANYKQKIAQIDAELILNKSMGQSFSKDIIYDRNMRTPNQNTKNLESLTNVNVPQQSLDQQQVNGNQYKLLKQFSLNKRSVI